MFLKSSEILKVDSILLHPAYLSHLFVKSSRSNESDYFSSSSDSFKQPMKSFSSVFYHANSLKYLLQPLKNLS